MKKLLLLLIGVTLISCQKDDDITNVYESNSGIGFDLIDNFIVTPPVKPGGKSVTWSHIYGSNQHTLSIDRSSNGENYTDTYTAGSINTLQKGTTGIRLSYGKWIASSTQDNAPSAGLTNYRVYSAESGSTSVNTSGATFRLTIENEQGLLLLPTSLAQNVDSGSYSFSVSDGYFYAYAFPGDHVVSITTPGGIDTFTVNVEAGVQYDLSESNTVALSESEGDGWYEVDSTSYSSNYPYTGVHITESVIDSVFYSYTDSFFDALKIYKRPSYSDPKTNIENTPISFQFEFLSYDNNSGKAQFNVTPNGDTSSLVELTKRTYLRSQEVYDQRLADFTAISIFDRISNLKIDLSTLYSYRSSDAPVGIIIPTLADAYKRSTTSDRHVNEYTLNINCYDEISNNWTLANSSYNYIKYNDSTNGDHDLSIDISGTYDDYTIEVSERYYGRREQTQNINTPDEYTYTYTNQHSYARATYNVETITECP